MADAKLTQLSGVQLPISGTDKIYVVRNGFSYQAPVSGLAPFNLVFTPLVNQPPASNYATLSTRNSIALLDFNDSVNQSGVFVGSLPFGAALSNGVNVDVKWLGATGTGFCVWGARFMPMNAAVDINVDAWAVDSSGISSITFAGKTTTQTLLVTGLSGMAGGDSFRLNVFRYANQAGDTLQGDAEVHTVVVRGV